MIEVEIIWEEKRCDDCISRQAAIEALDGQISVTGDINAKAVQNYIRMVNQRLHELPPAQPEVIRCKDCKHSEFWYRDKRRCFLWHEEGIDVFEDGFCNYAKRKDNG